LEVGLRKASIRTDRDLIAASLSETNLQPPTSNLQPPPEAILQNPTSNLRAIQPVILKL